MFGRWKKKPEPVPVIVTMRSNRTEQEYTRLEAENARLKLEARRGANIINSSLNPIWFRDPALKIVFCNLAYTEMVEETAESVVAQGEMELYKGHRILAQKAWETGIEHEERRHIVVNGDRRLYMIREVPLKNEGVVGYAKDLTELETAEEEIQRHISALRDLLESSTSAMAIFGRDQKLKFYNFAFVALWKLDEHWLDSEPNYGELLEMLREKRKLPEQANFKAFKATQQKLFTTLIEPQEEFLYLPDGKTLRTIAIPHALGGILFAYEDVTDRLALERSYNTLIAVQRETLDNLHEGIAVFGENGRLRLCNPIFHKLWKLSPEFSATEPHLREVLEQSRELFVAEDWNNYLERLLVRLQQRQLVNLRFERADGSVLDCAAVPLPDGATLLSFTDVTDSTLVERSLRERAEALEAADRMKTEFLANMSYELRSPLTSISGFAEMLKREYAGALSTGQRDYVEGIYQSSQQLGKLIADIIDLATIEAGYLKLDIREFDVRNCVEIAMGLMGEQLRYQGMQTQIDIAPDVTTMRLDGIRFKQILMNLVANALKVTKSKGVIDIRITKNNPLQGGILLAVHDHGPALDAQRRAQLFDPFFRAQSGQRAEAALSLTLVKRFVELHGGTVNVTSEEGQGTTITCTFPEPVTE